MLDSKRIRQLPLVKYALIALAVFVVLYYFTHPKDQTAIIGLAVVAVTIGLQLLFMIGQFVLIFWFMARSKDIMILPTDAKAITLEDYWGQPKLKALIQDWINVLDKGDDFTALGGEVISGFLLEGGPGVGKSFLARAMAGSTKSAFLGTDGSSFVAMFMGIDVLKVRALFSKARHLAWAYGSCILFIDEIDAVGRSRRGGQQQGQAQGMWGGGMMGMGSQALNRLLTELDSIPNFSSFEKIQQKYYQITGGFSRRMLKSNLSPQSRAFFEKWRDRKWKRDWSLIVIGATNVKEVLDAALTREGRLSRSITVSPPDGRGRKEIIEGYLKQIKHEPQVDVMRLVNITHAYTPVKLRTAIKTDAILKTVSGGRSVVSEQDILSALEEQAMGIPFPRDMTSDQEYAISVHESGHAIIQHLLVRNEKIANLTIIGRDSNLGYMRPVADYDVYSRPLSEIEKDIKVSLAGHAASKVMFGEYYTGARGGDFTGVERQLDVLVASGYFGSPFVKEDKAYELKRDYYEKWLAEVEGLLHKNYVALKQLSDRLLTDKEMNQQAVYQFFDGIRLEE